MKIGHRTAGPRVKLSIRRLQPARDGSILFDLLQYPFASLMEFQRWGVVAHDSLAGHSHTPSFDVPNNSASIGAGFVGSNSANGQILTSQAIQATTYNSLYTFPTVEGDGATTSTFGAVRNTIGSSRIIEMSLHLTY